MCPKSSRQLLKDSSLFIQGHSFSFSTPHAFSEPEQFISALFDSATVGLAIVDTDLRFVAVNQALAEMNGVPLKNHLGQPLRRILGDASLGIEPFFRRVLTRKRVLSNVEFKAVLPTRDTMGQWRETFFPIRSRSGRLKYIGAIVEELSVPTAVGSSSPDLGHSSCVDPQTPIEFANCKRPADQCNAGTQLNSAIFNGLSQDTAQMIWNAAKLRRCAPGDSFCMQGEDATTLFLLRRGLVKLCSVTRSGKETLLDWMVPGDVFGIGALLLSPTQHLWSVVAVEESEALSWTKTEVARFATLSPRTFENALQIAMRWCAELQQRFEELSDGFVPQRVAYLALHLAERFKKNGMVELSLSDADLAKMAGTNLYTINKLLRQWQRLGYIQKSRRRIRILDWERLKLLSCHGERAGGDPVIDSNLRLT
jgi:CRP-like cAMP-binding protein